MHFILISLIVSIFLGKVLPKSRNKVLVTQFTPLLTTFFIKQRAKNTIGSF